MKDALITFVAVSAFVTGLFAILFVPAGILDYSACKSRASAMHINSQWGPIMGCIIEYREGQWIPLDNYRGVDAKVSK